MINNKQQISKFSHFVFYFCFVQNASSVQMDSNSTSQHKSTDEMFSLTLSHIRSLMFSIQSTLLLIETEQNIETNGSITELAMDVMEQILKLCTNSWKQILVK
jgi:hypothetical protein